MKTDKQRRWALDQLQKSQFFHQRLHDWELIQVARRIDTISGASLDWELEHLNISDSAWNRIIHSGIKPVTVFAHPGVLSTIEKSVSYYRMLSMVSQKSMREIGLPVERYEQSNRLPDIDSAVPIARRTNTLISALIDSELHIERREFDIWRGMAAGSQAQGSWQNKKGDYVEALMRQDLLSQLQRLQLTAPDLSLDTDSRVLEIPLLDGRTVRLASEPDILLYSDYRLHAAVEVKGGIDPAGVLERVGAAIKSLSRAKDESPGAITILIMSAVSISPQAKQDIEANKSIVNYWFTIEDILQDSKQKQRYYSLLGITI